MVVLLVRRVVGRVLRRARHEARGPVALGHARDELVAGGRVVRRDEDVAAEARLEDAVGDEGLHKNDRTRLYQQLDNFGRELLAQRGRHPLPRWVYVTTVTQHFATSDGQYSNGRRSKRCQPSIPSNPRLESELSVLREGVNVDRILRVDDLDAGALHVGAYDGSDCTHYCMPGVPDVTAHRLLELVHPHNLRRAAHLRVGHRAN